MSVLLQRLQSEADVACTPCGDAGDLVWRRFGQAAQTRQGAPLVLLHGGAGSWTHWLHNIDDLRAAGHALWLPDMPGFGASAKPAGCEDADQMPPYLEQGARQLLGARPVHLIGFSFGGLVATYWAVAHPERVASLLLVGAPALDDREREPLPLRLWHLAPPGSRRDAMHAHNLRVLMLARDESCSAEAVALHGANVEADRMRRRRLMRSTVMLDLLPQLACPLRGIWGAEDVLYRDRPGVVARALERAPHFRGLTQVPGAGHWVPYEEPAAFAALALGWLREISPAAPRANTAPARHNPRPA